MAPGGISADRTSSGCGWATLNYCVTYYRVCMAVTGGNTCTDWQAT